MTENKDKSKEKIDGPLGNSFNMSEKRWKVLKEISKNPYIGYSHSTLCDRLGTPNSSLKNYINDFEEDGLVEDGKDPLTGTISNAEKRKGNVAKITEKGKMFVDKIEKLKEKLKEEKDLEYTFLDKDIEWFNNMTDKIKEVEGIESIQVCKDINSYMKEEDQLIAAFKSDLFEYLENKIIENLSFEINQEYWGDIEEGTISEEFRNVFRKNKVPISKSAKITVGENNFTVEDTEKKYFLHTEHETLFVFEGNKDIALAWLGELYRQFWKFAFLKDYEEWIEDGKRLQNLWSFILDKPVGLGFGKRMKLLEHLLNYYHEQGKEIEEEYLEKIVKCFIKSFKKYHKVGVQDNQDIFRNNESPFKAWKKIITENIDKESYLRDIKYKLIQEYGEIYGSMPYEVGDILRNEPYLGILPEREN